MEVKMSILVTGGAGYVGSVVAETLMKHGYDVVILDNLQQGHREAVPKDVRLIVGDIGDVDILENVFRRFHIEAVMHMAAETVVEYSMTDPKRYFHNNIIGGIALLDTMLKHGVNKLIFSSSASVYGEPQSVPIAETHPKKPVNSYGESKLMFEHILNWYGKAYGLKHISFRYFTAAGASSLLGEDHHPETHLIPNILRAAYHNSRPVEVFGTDYPTKDGSCVRDYVHVVDIARAHILGLEKIKILSGRAYNLGNGEGYSVMEVVATAVKIAGAKLIIKFRPRRAGDPAVLVASADKARNELGWNPEVTAISDIIESAWRWLWSHPNGYANIPVRQQNSRRVPVLV
jgi:UDP-glucose 4-epimerase